MQIIAHRGASGYFKENTLPAFEAALKMGSDFFETDVQLSADGALVLHHDYSFTDRSGTRQAIKTAMLAALSAAGIPTLGQLFSCLGPTVKINLEIKNDDNLYPGIEAKLLGELVQNPKAIKSRIYVSSFDYPSLQRVRALDGEIKIGVLVRNFDIAAITKLNATSLNISKARINAQIVQAAHAKGLKVFVYTVNAKQDIAGLADIGVDAVFSDYPDVLAK